MEWLNIIFGGFGGALIAALVAIYIHRVSQPKPRGMAYELLKKLQLLFQSTEAEYYFTISSNENYNVVKLLYSDAADAEIVATAFNENPESYGESDLARGFRYGSLFTRITCEDVCSSESASRCRTLLSKILRGAQLVVIPRGELISKIDGIFCRFKDSSYLCLLAFRDPVNPDKNRGILFRNGIAKGFFEYYKALAEKYTNNPVAQQHTSADQ